MQTLTAPAARRRHAARLTWAVIALHAGLLLALYVTPADLPARVTLFELLWARGRRELVLVFAVWLVAAPPLTALAWLVKGRHRAALLSAWLVAGGLLWALHHDRLAVMARVLRWSLAREVG